MAIINPKPFDYIPVFAENSEINLLYNSLYDVEPSDDIKTESFKRGFNRFYMAGNFLYAIHLNFVEYSGLGTDGLYWFYLDEDDEDFTEHPNSVYFAIGFDDPETTFFISEQENFDMAKDACQRFIRLHPDKKDFLQNILDHWQPKYQVH
ncbi:ribonuclease toxin immunity protein CdiI [Acinetobacter sp. c3-l95]|uniref:ribonuclease toxin immunity protein CdiI n=1 Tax=Acinetobacter sp. c3-l95 TaxID=3342804 RepID=UPI0035BB576D